MRASSTLIAASVGSAAFDFVTDAFPLEVAPGEASAPPFCCFFCFSAAIRAFISAIFACRSPFFSDAEPDEASLTERTFLVGGSALSCFSVLPAGGWSEEVDSLVAPPGVNEGASAFNSRLRLALPVDASPEGAVVVASTGLLAVPVTPLAGEGELRAASLSLAIISFFALISFLSASIAEWSAEGTAVTELRLDFSNSSVLVASCLLRLSISFALV
mmetsp:Transcript_3235/g.7256  ORF Transcript_3235/g.7256 Transcript_3235/m.7256 type:complete len:217 (+) Transcript_3235:2806-3456(+)